MKIGFITTSFPTFPDNSNGSFVLEMAKSLISLGHNIEIIVPDTNKFNLNKWDMPLLFADKIKIYPFKYSYPTTSQSLFHNAGAPDNLKTLTAKLQTVPALISMSVLINKRIKSWDAVVSHWLIPSTLAVGKTFIPHLPIAHSGDVHLLQNFPGGKNIAKLIAKNCNQIGFVSDDLRQKFLSLLPKQPLNFQQKFLITPMGYASDIVDSKSNKSSIKRSETSKFTILFIGRLVPIKGVKYLLEAIRMTQDVKLIIAGEGPLLNNFKEFASLNKLDVEFVGWVSKEQKKVLLKKCDALVYPSIVLDNNRQEGLPVTISEAQASGIPVIGTETGGIPELITHKKTGLLCAPGDSKSLKERILQIKSNPKQNQKLIFNAKQSSKKRSWDYLAPIYENYLK